MPRIPFDEEQKVVTTNFDFPKLKLKSGERARIILLESPVGEYTHTLRAPQIVDGKPVEVTAERKDGTPYTDYKKNFLSRPLCLGDFSILKDQGADPANCPMCLMAKEHPDWVEGAKRRFAMHVVRYKTKAGGFSLVTPFAVEVVVWAFTDYVFNQITDFKNEWKDLRTHDLLLGPCTNETFQKFEINVGASAEWLENDERKQVTAETFRNQQIPDLSIACGSKKEKRWIEEDLAKIREAWGIVEGRSTDTGQGQVSNTELSEDLAALLDNPPAAEEPAPAAAPATAAPVEDLDDLLAATVTPAAAEEPAAEEPAAEEVAEEEKAAETAPAAATDFDDLLKDL